jgi:hypothetical protein
MGRAIHVQYGALPYRLSDTNSLEILLVTRPRLRHEQKELWRWSVEDGERIAVAPKSA